MKREPARLRFSGLWFLFGPVLGCMWLAAVNYSNNLVYAVLYLVVSLSFISVFHAWRNLASIEIEHVRVRPAFAGEEIEVEIHLRNRSSHSTHNLVFERFDPAEWRGRRRILLRPHGGGTIHIDANDARTVTTTLAPARRGSYLFKALVVRSAYPFGLFSTSFQLTLERTCFVYPAPIGDLELPALVTSTQEGMPLSTRVGDDFSGVRPYSPGESLRHIDWKAYARGRPLAVKQFTGGQKNELWLETKFLAGASLEKNLSQLTLWAVEAERAGIPYGLVQGPLRLAPGLGPVHQRRVLEALAVADRI